MADQLDTRKNQLFESKPNGLLIDGAASMDHDSLKDDIANVPSQSVENGQCNNHVLV
jgi:hypothetical protein